MDNEKRRAELKEKEYQKYFGVTLYEKYQQEHKRGGRPSVLSTLDKLMITAQTKAQSVM